MAWFRFCLSFVTLLLASCLGLGTGWKASITGISVQSSDCHAASGFKCAWYGFKASHPVCLALVPLMNYPVVSFHGDAII